VKFTLHMHQLQGEDRSALKAFEFIGENGSGLLIGFARGRR